MLTVVNTQSDLSCLQTVFKLAPSNRVAYKAVKTTTHTGVLSLSLRGDQPNSMVMCVIARRLWSRPPAPPSLCRAYNQPAALK